MLLDIAKMDLELIWHPCSQMYDYKELPPIVIKRGKGVKIYDENDKEYIDIISSWWCNLLGHSNEYINNAIKNQLDEIEHVIFANFTHEGAVRLASRLRQILPPKLDKFNFSDNGSSAVESALKMAFQYQHQVGNTHKDKFICLSNAYHGETIGALSVGALDLYAKIYEPMLMKAIRLQAPDMYRSQFEGDSDEIATKYFEHYAVPIFEKYGKESVALIVEPILQAAAGMKIYPPLYLKKLRQICDEYEVLLIADEIATGFGRTGRMFACEHANISPDIMTLSKGLTGGYMPMSITATTNEIYDAFYAPYSQGKAFMHSHTYSGNPLGCAAANAVLDIFESQNILSQAQQNAIYLKNEINSALSSHKNVGQIRTIGLINAIELVEQKDGKKAFNQALRTGYQIYKKALKNGLILRPLGDVIYFNPPLNIQKNEMDEAIKRCVKSIDEVLGGF